MPGDDDLIVVRGGSKAQLEVDSIQARLEDAVDGGEGAVLSVCAEQRQADETVAEVVERASRRGDIPHRQVLVTSAARLIACGLDVVFTGAQPGEAPNHHHVVFTEPIATAQIIEFSQAWDEPIPNPTGGKKKPGGSS